MERNWAGNHVYAASALIRPSSPEELAALLTAAPRARAIGSRHSFTDLGDSDLLVSLEAMPPVFALDETAHTVTVGGGSRYGEVSAALEERRWALANLASLPHISLAGAVATGSHGSGHSNAHSRRRSPA